eukprot:TRINITY_DN9211_c0_g1_i1.p2 TRINITY_DN9211_c0_g1~~TRINITY_DN9211_c0_g1_i1.p2  ORF type:complete len:294 (-),score=58.41 TRINITY_DN9211_c0_g1_i1:35-916(-)
MRMRMSTAKSYSDDKLEPGDIMTGETVGRVMESTSDKVKVGQSVKYFSGWVSHYKAPAAKLQPVDASFPLSAYLHVLGMTGITAYIGLLRFGQPQRGETVVVSAASGAVGSVVGQIAKLKGCRVVGVAGAKEKCDFCVDELGFDACVSYKAADFKEQLKRACPKGVDVYFENVGGDTLDAVLPLFNKKARMPVCGFISQYNDQDFDTEKMRPDRLAKMLGAILNSRLTVRGFLVFDEQDLFEAAESELKQWFKDGKIKVKEDVANGLETAPKKFSTLFTGGNFGKLLVKVSAQ